MKEVENMWILEAIGIKNPVNEPYVPTNEEKLATEMLTSQLEYK